jgi:hypothetical protein
MPIVNEFILPQNFSPKASIHGANQTMGGFVDFWEEPPCERHKRPLTDIDEEWPLISGLTGAIRSHLNHSNRESNTKLSNLR